MKMNIWNIFGRLILTFMPKLVAEIQVFNIEGILAPVFTPFLETGRVDFDTIPIYMAHLNKEQVDGILIGGSTGEGMSLSVDERKSLLEAWITAAKPFGTKIIVQIGGAPMPHVIELAKHAEKVQAYAIMVLPELYYKPKNVEQLVHNLQRVSETAPTLPLIYYHFPMMSGVDVDMRELFSVASSKIPNFKGAKADLGTADQVASLLRPDQRIFIANHQIAPSVLMGHNSSIATVNNMFPDLVHNIVNAVKDGDVVKARGLQRRLNDLVDAIAMQGDFFSSMKAAMELITGIRMGPMREPNVSLTSEQRERLKNNLKSLDIQLQCA